MLQELQIRTESAERIAGPLRLCSWPGREFASNQFVPQFLQAVEGAGISVSGVDWPSKVLGVPCDVVMFHWLDWVFWGGGGTGKKLHRAAFLLRALAGLPRDTVLVWVVHNVEPHDRSRADRLLWSLLVRAVALRADGFATLSPRTVPVVRQAIPALARKPAVGVQHPLYPIGGEIGPEAAAIRREIGVPKDGRLVGYVGLLRTYKGLDTLIGAFREVRGRGLRMLLAGRDYRGSAATLKDIAGEDDRIAIQDGELSDSEFDSRLAACDLIVAPYRKYLHSGAMLHALSAGRPILTPSTPFSEGLREAVGGNWVQTYEGELTPAIIEDAVASLPDEPKPDLSAFGQDQIGQQIAGFLREMCRSKRARLSAGAHGRRLRRQKIWNT